MQDLCEQVGKVVGRVDVPNFDVLRVGLDTLADEMLASSVLSSSQHIKMGVHISRTCLCRC